MRKFEAFFVYLTAVRALVRKAGNNNVKEIIGDSTNNKRTVTVSQVERFLMQAGDVEGAEQLQKVTAVLETEILNRRNRRTDAIDLTELTNTYREVVMNKGALRREIGRTLSTVSR